MHQRGPTPDQDSLTRREAEVIDLVADGLSNKQIAETTALSPNSVKSFIRSAYRKIGAEKREHAIEWVLERRDGHAAG